MKLRVTEQPLGFGFQCIDDNEYDGAPDAGPQLVGNGKTEQEAKADFMDQWMERESERDCKRAVNAMKVWDGVFAKLFGVK